MPKEKPDISLPARGVLSLAFDHRPRFLGRTLKLVRKLEKETRNEEAPEKLLAEILPYLHRADWVSGQEDRVERTLKFLFTQGSSLRARNLRALHESTEAPENPDLRAGFDLVYNNARDVFRTVESAYERTYKGIIASIPPAHKRPGMTEAEVRNYLGYNRTGKGVKILPKTSAPEIVPETGTEAKAKAPSRKGGSSGGNGTETRMPLAAGGNGGAPAI